MEKISHIEEKNLLAYSHMEKNFDKVNKYIEKYKNNWSHYIEENNRIYGFNIRFIKQLSNLYNTNVFAVEFFFKNIVSLFNNEDNEKIKSVIEKLERTMLNRKGYYIIKIPSSNMMLINNINLVKEKFIFAGNTINYCTNTLSKSNDFFNDGLEICIANQERKSIHAQELLKLSENSFKDHFTQYHLSHITREKAPHIYKNWIYEYLGHSPTKKIIISKYDNKLAGFIAYNEHNEYLEIILNCVDEKFRGRKIYERMVKEVIKNAINNNKYVTVSTQLDNYFPQRAWINCGLKPYYSFYLMHYSNLGWS